MKISVFLLTFVIHFVNIGSLIIPTSYPKHNVLPVRVIQQAETKTQISSKLKFPEKDSIDESIQKYVEVNGLVMTSYDSHGNEKPKSEEKIVEKHPNSKTKTQQENNDDDKKYHQKIQAQTHQPEHQSIKNNHNSGKENFKELNNKENGNIVKVSTKSKEEVEQKHGEKDVKEERGRSQTNISDGKEESGKKANSENNSNKAKEEENDYFFIKQFSSGYEEKWDNKDSKKDHDFYDEGLKDGYFKRGMGDNVFTGFNDAGYKAGRNSHWGNDGGLFSNGHSYEDSQEDNDHDRFNGKNGNEIQYGKKTEFYDKNGIAKQKHFNFGSNYY